MSVGAEYNLMQLVQLRTGYHYGERRDYYPSYWTVGAGVRILHLRLTSPISSPRSTRSCAIRTASVSD